MLISIILPTFNESGNIKKLILSLIINLKKEKIKNWEIIIVDDNSTDGTAEIVDKIRLNNKNIRLFIRTKTPGLALSVKKGIDLSKGKMVLVMDSDFNHKPIDALRLIKEIQKNDFDLVIGSRYIKGGGMALQEATKLQFFCSKFFNIFLRFFLGFKVHESLSGFFIIKKRKLNKLPQNKIFKGYGDYFINLVYFSFKNNFKIFEIPVRYGKRLSGKSKTKLLKHSLAYFKTACFLKFKNP